MALHFSYIKMRFWQAQPKNFEITTDYGHETLLPLPSLIIKGLRGWMSDVKRASMNAAICVLSHYPKLSPPPRRRDSLILFVRKLDVIITFNNNNAASKKTF